VPTFAELGWPAAEAGIWQGLLAPARTATALIDRHHRTFAEALTVPATRERLEGLGAQIRAEGPDSFRQFLASETETWSAVIRARGIRLE
jgi:tripartite-type tricarboxylate transporter receptor subunit TctC